MIAREFPNLQWLKRQAEEGFVDRQGMHGKLLPQAGWPSVVMNAKSRQVYRDNIRGPFSIFTNISGVSSVTADGKRAIVRDDFFFVTNQDQHYTLAIEEKREIETCNIHFGQFLAGEVIDSFTQSAEKSLDNGVTAGSGGFHLHNRLYRRSEVVNGILNRLRSVESDMHEQELLCALMFEILKEDQNTKKILLSLPSQKLATREEILRRLTLATDYVYEYHDTDISLDDLASIACVSKFHFIRLFKSAFSKSPHQFISEVRMERAKHLLRSPDVEIKQIGRQLGFKDASSFSRMFFKFYGVYPTQFQR